VDLVAGIKVAAISTVTVCYHSMMKWLQWNPDRNSNLGTLLALLIIVGVLAILAVYLPNFLQQNSGFGPDWDCTPQAKGGPICIKKPGR